VQLQIVDASTVDELEKRLRAIRRDRPDSILITADLVFYADKDRVVRAVRGTGLPAIFQDRVFVVAGGLMSYGADENEINRTLAAQVDKILKGARPGELPVEQVTKLELSVNMKTARILGIAFPQSILLRADEVIR
jgi:putative ABC transport system substrate-binding protein